MQTTEIISSAQHIEMDTAIDKAQTSIMINGTYSGNVTTGVPRYITIELINTGSTSLRDYEYWDVFADDILASAVSGSSMPVKFAYISGRLDNIYQWNMSVSPDVINPGYFDPGETMNITIAGIRNPEWIRITAPNGARASYTPDIA